MRLSVPFALSPRHRNGGQIWVLFGCGGDRDRGKRAEMGAVACRFADHVVVTSDNPRSEAPEAIIRDILCGCEAGSPVIEADRAAAIALRGLRGKCGRYGAHCRQRA